MRTEYRNDGDMVVERRNINRGFKKLKKTVE